MTEVGVKCFGSGDGKKHRTQCIKPDNTVVEQKRDAVGRIKRPQYSGIAGDPNETRYRNGYKPHRSNRTEKGCDLCGTARLKRKQHD